MGGPSTIAPTPYAQTSGQGWSSKAQLRRQDSRLQDFAGSPVAAIENPEMASPLYFKGGSGWASAAWFVMEEAASERQQSHREDRQDGDHTHYKLPLRKIRPLKEHVSCRHWWRNCNSRPTTWRLLYNLRSVHQSLKVSRWYWPSVGKPLSPIAVCALWSRNPRLRRAPFSARHLRPGFGDFRNRASSGNGDNRN